MSTCIDCGGPAELGYKVALTMLTLKSTKRRCEACHEKWVRTDTEELEPRAMGIGWQSLLITPAEQEERSNDRRRKRPHE